MPQRRFRATAGLGALLAFLVIAAPPVAAPAMTALPLDAEAQVARVGGLSLALGVSLAQLNGTASELAFDYPRGRKFKLSELTWDLKQVALGGAQASVGLAPRLTLSVGLWRALNEGNGGMVDRDWEYRAAIEAGLVDSQQIAEEDWTHESRHPDTTVDDATLFDLNLAWRAWQSGPFSVCGLVGWRQEAWQWSARGGSFVYSLDGFRDFRGEFKDRDGRDLLVIDYEQRYALPYLGMAATWQNARLRVRGHLLLSGAVQARDRDLHLLRHIIFSGDFAGGSYLGAGLDARWHLSPRWFATLAVEYQSFNEITGDVAVVAPGGSASFGSGGGLALETTTLGVGAGFRF